MNRKRLATIGTLAALVVIGVGASAGSCDTHKDAPSPSGSHIVNGTNAVVIQSADGFRNVYFSCYGTTGVYVTSDGASNYASGIAVLASDPACVK